MSWEEEVMSLARILLSIGLAGLWLVVGSAAEAGPRLYVSNEFANTVSVIDVETEKAVATIPVGKRPRGIKASPDRRRVYVASGEDNVIAVIDTAKNEVKQWVELPGIAYGTAPTPDGRWLLVALIVIAIGVMALYFARGVIGVVTAEAEPQWSIVERAIAGDEVAFARIVAAHHDDMARIAYFVCGDLDIAEEAEQSAWAVACHRLRDLRDPDRLRPWLMSIAANEARQIARSRRRRTVRELALADPTRASDVDHAAMVDLANALGRLDAKDRAIVGLRFLGGFESVEIGRALGMSASGVRVRLHRILERLRRDLGDD